MMETDILLLVAIAVVLWWRHLRWLDAETREP